MGDPLRHEEVLQGGAATRLFRYENQGRPGREGHNQFPK